MSIRARVIITKKYIDYIMNVVIRTLPFNYATIKNSKHDAKPYIVGMIRERNESLVLKDTLDHAAGLVDGIIVFDDSSTDNSVEIARNHPAVLEVVINKKWQSNQRKWEETANRAVLFHRAKKYKPEWFFYFDADERFEGDIKQYLKKEVADNIGAIKISLLDAYITKNDKKSFTKSDKLMNFRKKFGIERRDILMIWRRTQNAKYRYPDSREPIMVDNLQTETKFWCQHYGKSISIQQWEETCRYYIDSFPMYSEKWKQRLGKAVHEKSDFDTKLYDWNEAKLVSKKIY